MSLVLAYITAKDKEEARALAKSILENRLAACVNLVDQVESHFWWQDKLEESKETILIVKTSSEKQNELCELVKNIHSYDCPCVLFVPIVSGSTEYLNWISKELNPE